MKQPAVYILASKRNGTLYTGVTSNLVQRIWQHKQDAAEGFTSRHGIHQLVWYEQHDMMETAIQRETQIKKWNRASRIRLKEETNPYWTDLYPGIC